jgi:hypothetical protein
VTWPTGGRQLGRPHLAFYTNRRGVERLQITVPFDLASAIAVEDEEALAWLLEAITSKMYDHEDFR